MFADTELLRKESLTQKCVHTTKRLKHRSNTFQYTLTLYTKHIIQFGQKSNQNRNEIFGTEKKYIRTKVRYDYSSSENPIIRYIEESFFLTKLPVQYDFL